MATVIIPRSSDRRPFPQVTGTGLPMYSMPLESDTSKSLSRASTEHNEYFSIPQSKRKKGLLGFFKGLNGPDKKLDSTEDHIPNTMYTSHTRDHAKDIRKFKPSDIHHARAEALLGKPKNTSAKLSEPQGECNVACARQPLSKPELQSFFSGAPCFECSKQGERYSGRIWMYDEEEKELEACTVEPGNTTFKKFVRAEQSPRDHIVRRVFGRFQDTPLQSIARFDGNPSVDLGSQETTFLRLAGNRSGTVFGPYPFSDATQPLDRLDFTSPDDGFPVMGNEVRYDGISSAEAPDSSKVTPLLTFSSPVNFKVQALDVSISYNVQFVSSHPCHPRSCQQPLSNPKPKPQGTCDAWGDCLPSDFVDEKRLRSSSNASPTDSACSFQLPPDYSHVFPTSTSQDPPPAHLLHNAYRYKLMPVALLLSMSQSESLLTIHKDNATVVVLDCRGTEDLQLLARAWCAQEGKHAVVAETKRTCLSCAIREARALGIRIVIRH